MLIKKIKGFSLVELLISLIVISCITAAFTPLITKKFATNIGFNGGSVGDIPSISSDCSSRYSSDCLLCTSSECLSCTKTCPEGQCQDSTNCTCKECPTSEYPNCAKFTSTACIQCQKGFRLVEGVCVACTSEKYSDNGKECKYCEPGFWPNNNSTGCVECPEGYICNNGIQTKCSGATAPTIEEDILGNKNHVCAPCTKEFYCEDGVAKGCSEKWKDCVECDTNGCTKCNEGTNLVDGKCVESMDDILLIDNLYVTKFNMGDRPSLPIPSTVTMLTAGSSADACESGKCCWQGTTAGSCDAKNGGYSGCNRIICNWAAAQEICARFDLNGESWRLPTKAEASGWNARTLGVGAEGLQLCSNTSSQNNNYARCQQSSKCYGAYQKYCYANYVWTNEMSISGSSFYVYAHYLNGTSWNNSTVNGGYSGSVRCVATVSDCPKGQYKNGTSCTDCTTKFTHCTACSSSKCFACDIGYELHPYNNKCYKVIEDAVPVDNLYVTRYNMGDGGLPIPPSVTVIDLSTGSNCTSEKCCWKGTTADTNTCQNKDSSTNGGYSGCTRTVCNWHAANEICARYTAGDKTWRLPNYGEMGNWYNYTVALGAAGPQLCDDARSTTITNCWYSPKYPGRVWAQQSNTSSAYVKHLQSNSWSTTTLDKNSDASVRCVTAINYDE